MIKGLQAGFGPSIAADIPALRDLSVGLVRLDCQGFGPLTTRSRAIEVRAAGLIPFTIVDSRLQLDDLPSGINVEYLNEPDLRGISPHVYRASVLAMARRCEDLGLHLWAGAVSNLHTNGLAYLDAAGASSWPASVNVSVHRYPHGDTPQTPQPGSSSRADEVSKLRRVIGTNRPWGVSEFGYHTASRANWWQRILGIRKQWTDDQVAEMVAWEWDFWELSGARGAVLYQLNDGPTTGRLDRYGIRRTDGTWKPVAKTFTT